jgi:hypothetical protein
MTIATTRSGRLEGKVALINSGAEGIGSAPDDGAAGEGHVVIAELQVMRGKDSAGAAGSKAGKLAPYVPCEGVSSDCDQTTARRLSAASGAGGHVRPRQADEGRSSPAIVAAPPHAFAPPRPR